MPQLKKKNTLQSGAPIQAKSNRKFARFFFLLLTIENMCDEHWIFYNSAILVFFYDNKKNPFKFKNKTKRPTEIS